MYINIIYYTYICVLFTLGCIERGRFTLRAIDRWIFSLFIFFFSKLIVRAAGCWMYKCKHHSKNEQIVQKFFVNQPINHAKLEKNAK